MNVILEKLYQSKILTKLESYQLFENIINGQLSSIQLTAALIAMKTRGESQEEILGAVKALLDNAKPFPRPKYIFADIVGTGGDLSRSLNISTASALVAASCGLKIVKHGSKGNANNFGSSETLTSLGINLNITPDNARKILDELNICFIFAPIYHTGFYHAIEVRQQLKTRTIFNILGPLVNPARPPLSVVGVYSPKLLLPVINILKVLEYKRAIVVHGGGMDEVILHDINHVAELQNGKITLYHLTAKDFGFKYHSNIKALTVNSIEESCNSFIKLIKGYGNTLHEETIAANVALLLKIFGYENLRDNAQHALNIIHSGQVYKLLLALASRG
ncbi:anthranilate phosphoribosyltransferase [Candidatus Pantoea edessiphila]|uniref:Anthranilate phosphoribosyltransferase n=1 Tax=Candidatus Pantoea edessiphila TaxID=2044610 RepID=A0A2P5SYQ0_9GAMM|nr:anthranilate phosphoribosyltransferase [Pantoea sp. Edef]PPI87455.1 anthranilate phosphoribosyltransferase [Candidatus Pantoea edessiphila]